MNKLTIDKVSFFKMGGKIGAGSAVALTLEAVAPLTVPLAEHLDAKWAIHDRNHQPRGSVKRAELPLTLPGWSAIFTPQAGLENYELQFQGTADKFTVFTSGDGKKKAFVVRLRFRLTFVGDMLVLLGMLLKIGRAEGTLTLKEQAHQGSLPIGTPAPPREGKGGRVIDMRNSKTAKPAKKGKGGRKRNAGQAPAEPAELIDADGNVVQTGDAAQATLDRIQ